MDFKDIIAKVTSVAPLIGSLFGPGGTIIGSGVKLLASALGVQPTQEAVMAEIASNPEALLKLKQLESNNTLELQKLSIEQLRLELADTQGARQRQVDSEKATGKRDYNLYILAWTMVVGFFVLLGFLMKYPVPEDQSGVIFMLFGALSTAFGCVIQYFFGSSKSSSDKTELMGQMRKGMK
jgi:hypothetical protein